MAQTVLGFFDDATEARRAIEKLESAGISRSNVDISNRGGESTGREDVSNTRDSDDNGVTRFFKSLFGTDDDADRYSKVAERCTVVTVHAQTEDQAERAADILDECGAIDVDERSQQYASNRTTGRETSGRQQTSIPRVEENLRVGKQSVEGDRVRVRSRIVEKPVEEQVRLREEHINVERQQVDRPATEADFNNLRDRNIDLTERSEIPVVNKEARVVEEVKISKEVNQRNETVRDTVRKTEIDVDKDDSRNRTTDRDRTDRNDRDL
jgi:stress response protein YsnF